MPPINQPQGSRGGLITAMVVFAILFLTAAIFAVYFNVNMRAEQLKYDNFSTKYKNVVADGTLVPESDIANTVKSLKDSDPAMQDASLKWVDVLSLRGDRLAKVIAGQKGIPGLTAESEAASRVAANNEKLRAVKGLTGVSVAPDDLLGSIDTLVKALIAKDAQLASANTKAVADLSANKAGIATSADQVAEAAKKAEASAAEAEKARAELAKDRSEKQAQVETLTADLKKTTDELSAAVQAKELELTTEKGNVAKRDARVAQLEAKLANYRLDTMETTVRRADGQVTGIGANSTCYINLGQGQSVNAGMTFEVYDRAEGVPSLSKGNRDGLSNDEMPIGKGSIEIVRVGPATSECRIVKMTPGMAIAEGDLIANLVYDQNVKFNFVIYGKYDLDRNGVPTDADTEVMKRLVTQWGGKVMDAVNADTDFVVLGKEPVLPTFSPEELNLPENAKKLADAVAEQDAYNKIKADARDVHIPVMNQNRFLYFVGYYDQSKR